MSKRKRPSIKKARAIILKTADEFQKAGIDCSHRSVVVGGARPKLVLKEWKDREKDHGIQDIPNTPKHS
jgi:hypothetical protein